MIVIGLTGSFGTGKSFVASIFKSLGAKVIDGDKIAHSLLKKPTKEYNQLIGTFGPDILDRKDNIDRKKLAFLVFGNKKKIDKLNHIIHPSIIKIIKKKIQEAKAEGASEILIDAPLLIEADLFGIIDKLIVVKASLENQFKRTTKKFGINRKEALRRIKSQMPLEKKIKLADFVIDNDCNKSDTIKQVKEIRRKLWK